MVPNNSIDESAVGTMRSNAKQRINMLRRTGFTESQEENNLRRWRKFYALPSISEYFISVDHHKIWRRHMAWSLRDGDHLRNAVTNRFASNMVFMSLLLGSEIGVLFSPSKPADLFRLALRNSSYDDPNFWAAIVLCISIGMTLSTLVANFTAWAIISALSARNAHSILRSSIGLYAAQLPARLVVLSIYCFAAWIFLFMYILLPSVWSLVIAIFPVLLIMHIVLVYSAFGRLVMYTKAMGSEGIFECEEEDSMTPKRLFEALLQKATDERKKQTPLPLYYKTGPEIASKISKISQFSLASNHPVASRSYVDNGFDSQHESKILDDWPQSTSPTLRRTNSSV